MSKYHVVKLITNHLYPTYQLHAFMANKKTTPQDGLRIAALTTIEWLGLRLGEHAPEEIRHLPEPADYQKVNLQDLRSFYINSGFIINVVSLPEEGIWTLQISEPDMGSEPGNPEQARPAVSGRVIETNVAFKIVNGELECGFRTVISDPDAEVEQAEVYRLAIIRRLLENPAFGLRQIVKLQHEYSRITNAEQLKNFSRLAKSTENQIPCILFTQVRNQKSLPEIENMIHVTGMRALPQLQSAMPVQAKAPAAEDPQYDIAKFSRSGVTYCRTYLLDDALMEKAGELFHTKLNPGDILAIEPASQGGKTETFSYSLSRSGRNKTIETLQKKYYTYCRGREYFFGNIEFLTTARNQLIQSTEEAKKQAGRVSETLAQEMEKNNAAWQERLKEKDREIESLKNKLSRQREYQIQLENEKVQLQQECEQKTKQDQTYVENLNVQIDFLKRKLDRPEVHDGVADWAERYFSDHLEIHPKAARLLCDRSSRNVDLTLICDALDFLATDYWDCRYLTLDKDQMRTRCSLKYGRPFEVKPVGNLTIEQVPTDYKIKYSMGDTERRMEHGLDYHLKVGNDPENLLRIYFLHDDIKKKVIVGSLPLHLKAVKIQ